ncbi:MAG: RNA polymerase sigma factor [Phycisphaerae bacterium]
MKRETTADNLHVQHAGAEFADEMPPVSRARDAREDVSAAPVDSSPSHDPPAKCLTSHASESTPPLAEMPTSTAPPMEINCNSQAQSVASDGKPVPAADMQRYLLQKYIRIGNSVAHDLSEIAYNEDELVSMAVAGDVNALNLLLQKYRPLLLRTARRCCRQEADAEDAVQEACKNACCRVHQFDGRARFETWLCRIVINAALTKNRRERTVMLSLPDHPVAIDDGALDALEEAEHRRAVVSDALRRVSEQYRLVLDLFYRKKASYEQMAKILNLTLGGVGARLSRAREALRTVLAKMANEEAP